MMTRWEYKVVNRDTQVESTMNALGAEGWELITATSLPYFIFRRPLRDDQPTLNAASAKAVEAPSDDAIILACSPDEFDTLVRVANQVILGANPSGETYALARCVLRIIGNGVKS